MSCKIILTSRKLQGDSDEYQVYANIYLNLLDNLEKNDYRCIYENVFDFGMSDFFRKIKEHADNFRLHLFEDVNYSCRNADALFNALKLSAGAFNSLPEKYKTKRDPQYLMYSILATRLVIQMELLGDLFDYLAIKGKPRAYSECRGFWFVGGPLVINTLYVRHDTIIEEIKPQPEVNVLFNFKFARHIKPIKKEKKKAKICCTCGQSTNIVHHHVFPVCLYPSIASWEKNICYLCKECHIAYHKIYGKLYFCNYDTLKEFAAYSCGMGQNALDLGDELGKYGGGQKITDIINFIKIQKQIDI